MQPQFIVIDPNLRSIGGHYAEYDRAVTEGARRAGFAVSVLGHREIDAELFEELGATRVYSEDIWGSAATGSRVSRAVVRLAQNFRFLKETLRGLRLQPPMGPKTVVFVHTFISGQFLALAVLPLLFRAARRARFVYLLRYQPGLYSDGVSGLAFWLIGRLPRWRDIHLTSDSARLAERFERLIDAPIGVLPIPHAPPPARNVSRSSDTHVVFVSLGNARDEKGILEILEAMALLREQGRLSGMKFILQCNDPDDNVTDAISRFRAIAPPECVLINEALPSNAYYDLLSSADVVLLPYWRSIYLGRTSGVFMEAVAAGKPVIVTADTWMSDQLTQYGAGLVTRDRSARYLAEMLVRARDEIADLTTRAQGGRQAWLKTHSQDTLIRAITTLSSDRGPPNVPPRRVLVLYPHDDFMANQTGASRRVNLLVEVLTEWGLEVRVLQSGLAPRELVGSVIVESLGIEPANRLSRSGLFALLWIASLGRGARHWWMFWQFARLSFIRPFRDHIRQHVGWADIVLTEYPFWVSVVSRLTRRRSRKLLLTSYDILSDQLSDTAIPRVIIARLEARAFRLADRVCLVSRDDMRVVNKLGVDAVLAPNPTDGRMFELARIPNPRALLWNLFGIDPRMRRFGLFVGSAFEPNVRAVEIIRACAPALVAEDVGFVIAGGCAEPGRNEDVLALGRVDDATLLLLYAACDFVVAPIPFGTGTSLKTIEAMAAGKVVVGTSVAFRGLVVESGREALIEDRIDQYPAVISELLADQRTSERIRAAATRFARAYDARIAFLPYLDALSVPRSRAVDPREGALDRTLIALAGRARDRGCDDLAITLAREALRTSPDHLEARAIAQGRATTTDLMATTESDWAAARKEIAVLLRRKDYTEVIARARAAMANESDRAEVSFLLAEALTRAKLDPDEAMSLYQEALTKGFDPYWIWIGMGRLAGHRGERLTALRLFLRAVGLRPFRRYNVKIALDTLALFRPY